MLRFSEILKKYRHQAGLTQQQLGDRLRLSSPYIAQIESGLKPPPSADLAGRMARVLRIKDEEAQAFLDLARKERGRQSLVKATKKLGYALSGNNVLVPETAISNAVRGVVADMFDAARNQAERGAFVAGLDLADDFLPEDLPLILRRRDEMLPWLMDYMGEEPQVGLAFLSLLYESLRLIGSNDLICREPTPLRRTIDEERGDPGRLLARLKSTIDRARDEVGRSAAPHVVSLDESSEATPDSMDRTGANRYIPIIGVVGPETDVIRTTEDLDPLEIPRSWLDKEADYRAVQVRSDAFEGFGIWPGTMVLFEMDAEPAADDIVVIKIDNRLTMMVVKMRIAEEENLILQGGGRSAPVVYLSRKRDATIVGVVRHFMSTFRDLRKSRRSGHRVREGIQ